jgi:hypothetical protein
MKNKIKLAQYLSLILLVLALLLTVIFSITKNRVGREIAHYIFCVAVVVAVIARAVEEKYASKKSDCLQRKEVISIIAIIVVLAVLALTAPLITLRTEYGWTCARTGSRHGYTLWLGFIKASKWHAQSPAEELLLKTDRQVVHDWVKTEGQATVSLAGNAGHTPRYQQHILSRSSSRNCSSTMHPRRM